MITEATGVALTIFTIGSERNLTGLDTDERTARAAARKSESRKPDIIRINVNTTVDQKEGSDRFIPRLCRTRTGDGRKSSSPIKREAHSHTATQKRMARILYSLLRVVEIIGRDLSTHSLRILIIESIEIE